MTTAQEADYHAALAVLRADVEFPVRGSLETMVRLLIAQRNRARKSQEHWRDQVLAAAAADVASAQQEG